MQKRSRYFEIFFAPEPVRPRFTVIAIDGWGGIASRLEADTSAASTEKFPESRSSVGIHDGDIDNVVDLLVKGVTDVPKTTGFWNQ